jgi:arsenite methyltransferase
MTQKDVCILGSGGWPPKNNTDGHQLPVNTSELTTKAKNQLEGAAFTEVDIAQIRAAIRQKYASVSSSAEGYFKYPVGKAGAALLGYDEDLLAGIPSELLNSFCGVGNPFGIEGIENGCSVLDIGCGAGFDLYVASCLVGAQGKVFGVDLTEEMIDRARANLSTMQVTNAEIHLVSSEQLPFADDFFDVVISSGVINLSPDKQRLFTEIYRVLKPGGRLQFADIILEKELPPHLAASVESWSQWIGGAIPGGDQITLMENAGFVKVRQLGVTPIKTSEYTIGALFSGIKV